MAFCGKVKDIEKACDSVALNLNAQMYAVRFEAFAATRDAQNPFLITELQVKDPATGAYPVEASAFYPVKIEWLNNSVIPNYEPVEGVSVADSYTQTVGPVVISDSETAAGKANTKALNAHLWVIVAPLKGVANNDAIFHIYGIANGLKFVPAATAVEFGNRVAGTFTSLAGAEEATPNGVNWLDGTYAATLAQFNNRLETVVIP